MNGSHYYSVYWKSPAKGASPRTYLKVRGAGNAKLQVTGIKVAEGVVKYEVPETEDNRILTDAYGDNFSYDNPVSSKAKIAPKQKVIKEPEEKPEPIKVASPTRRLSKIEVMDMLSKAGIKFRTNESPETLYRKLPDDIRRNFKLDKS